MLSQIEMQNQKKEKKMLSPYNKNSGITKITNMPSF